MFVVWEDGKVKIPYTPGSIGGRRVEKVHNVSRLRKVDPHTSDWSLQAQESEASQAAEAYRQLHSRTQVRQPAILAKQIMTSPVATLPPTTPISAAWEVIKGKRFRHIPVLSEEGQLVGILSDRDLFRAAIERSTASDPAMVHALRAPIYEIMVTKVLSAYPETEIRTIARVLFEERIGAMPLVNDQEDLVGILTRSDILRTVVNEAPFELWI